jgi:hypothetical protein
VSALLSEKRDLTGLDRKLLFERELLPRRASLLKMAVFCAYPKLETTVYQAGEKENKKFQKRGLILFENSAIMWNCMKLWVRRCEYAQH